MALINDLRPDLPGIASVDVLNPNIEPSELSGKYIILDVLARDAEGIATMSKSKCAVTGPGTSAGCSTSRARSAGN